MTSWDSTIWWQVYPLGFVGAETRALAPGAPVHHRLSRIEAWLDYAVELGCSGLALGPIFASETHGYDTVDLPRLRPRLGHDRDFDSLVAAAHDRGMRVLLDGVFNHVGRGFPGFAAALSGGAASPAARWVRPRRPPRGRRGGAAPPRRQPAGFASAGPRAAGSPSTTPSRAIASWSRWTMVSRRWPTTWREGCGTGSAGAGAGGG